MKESVYGHLQQDAKTWWFNANLRASGKIAEARVNERVLIRSRVKSIRECKKSGGYALVGMAGWIVYISQYHRVSGHDWNSDYILAARVAGVPVVDIRNVTGRNLVELLSLPVIGFPGDIDEFPWKSFDRAPLEYVAWRMMMLGADVYNVRLPRGLRVHEGGGS